MVEEGDWAGMDERGWEEILAKARTGDEQAWNKLALYLLPLLNAYFLRRVPGDRQAAEEMANETFRRLWRAVSNGALAGEERIRGWRAYALTTACRSTAVHRTSYLD